MTVGFFLAGLAANACVRIDPDNVTVSSADANFPKTALQDGSAWNPYKFGTLAADQVLAFDTNKMFNGDLEDSADGVLPAGWSGLSGSPTTSTDQADDGTKSLKLDSANEGAFQDHDVPTGTTHRISAALWGDGTNLVNAYVIDLISGKYLLNNGTWSLTKTAWASRTTASFETSVMTFTLEAPVEGQVGPVQIRVLFERPGTIAGAAYVDSVVFWPKTTVAALIYDTIPTAFPIAVESADDAAFSSNLNDHGDLPAQRFRRYLTFAGPATPQRYWRFAMTGTPSVAPWVSVPILGERKAFIRSPRFGILRAQRMPKGGTDELPASMADAPRYRFEMRWRGNRSGLKQIGDEMVGGSFHGDEPVFVVPDVDQPEMVYGRGRGLEEIVATRVSMNRYEYSLSFEDERFPTRTK